MFKTRIAILFCLPLFFTAAVSSLAAEQQAEEQGMTAAGDVRFLEPGEDIALPLPDLDYLEYLAMVPEPDNPPPSPDNPEDRAERKARHEERRANHEKRIELFRLWRVMNELSLTDDQVDKFFPLMRQVMKKEREQAENKHGLMKRLREELEKEKPSETELKRMMTEVKNQAELACQQRMADLDQFAKILNVEQQARLLLSMNEVEKDIWESIARARMAPMIMPEFKFDREKLDQHFKDLRKNLDSLNIRLHMKGLPGLPEGSFDLEDLGEDQEP